MMHPQGRSAARRARGSVAVVGERRCVCPKRHLDRESVLQIKLTGALLPVRDLRVTGGYVHRTQDAILSDLLRGLAPSEVSVIVQIIIRDLSPLLYPPPTPNATASLVNYNSAAYTIVTVEDALRYWAPDARSLYCAVADLDRVAWLVDVHLRESADV